MSKKKKSAGSTKDFKKMIIEGQKALRAENQKFDLIDTSSDKAYGDYIFKKAEKMYNQLMGFIDNKKYKSHFNSGAERKYKQYRLEIITKYANLLAKPLQSEYKQAGHVFCKCNLMTPTYRQNEPYTNDRLLATALYVLDALTLNKSIDEAVLYIPKCAKSDIFEFDIEISDACYETDLILGMMKLIRDRNCNNPNETGGFINYNSLQYTLNTKEPIKYQKSIYENNNDDDDDNLPDQKDIRRKAETMSYRERLNHILSLLPEYVVERSVKNFKNKAKELFKMLAKAYDMHHKLIVSLQNEIISYHDEIIEQCDIIIKNEDERQQKHETKKQNSVKPFAIYKTINMPEINKTVPTPMIENRNSLGGNMGCIINSRNNINELLKKIDKVSERIEALDENYAKLIAKTYDTDRYEDNCIDTMVAPACDFTVDNPYEICFAYFMMLETGDDFPWLINLPEMLLAKAIDKLPWTNNVNEKLFEILKDASDTISINTVLPETTQDNSENEKKLYDFKYTDAALWSLFGIKKIPKKDLKKTNYAQLVYMCSGFIMPRNVFISENMSKGLKKSGIQPKNINNVAQYINTTQYNFAKTGLPDFDLDKDEMTQSDKINDLNSKITSLTAEIASLKSALHSSEQQISEYKKNIENITNEHRFEKDELNNLRELIYENNNQNNQDIDETPETEQIIFPYATRQKTVIFGGHETWIKEMKTFFKNVRFINPNERPNESLIRNTDVIWMQTNAMPHSSYLKIMNIARTQKIPVQYFWNASAKKNALQLAEQDMKEK